MSGVEESLISLPFLSLPLVSSVFPPGREKVSVPSPPYEEHVENAAMVFGMDAGDADPEVVVVALDDGELVVVVAALSVREASTRASGRARADEATTDGDPGWTRETLTKSLLLEPDSTVSLSLSPSPYACAKRRRERRAACARTRRRRVGNTDGRGRR